MGSEFIKRSSLEVPTALLSDGIILTSILLLAVILIVYRYLLRPHQQTQGKSEPLSVSIEKNSDRQDVLSRVPGVWVPSTYTFPKPPSYPNWSIETTKPLLYRPFRYGPNYFVTMGLRNIKPEDWIELDNDFPRFHQEKARRILDRGSKCCHTTPEAYPAAVELLEELASYLPARYPSLYQRTKCGIKNLWSGEEINTTSRPLSEDPMQTCGRLIQDDLAIMVEKPDGKHYLQAGAILLAGFWRLEDKLGMQLSEIHTSGHVPHYKEKLEKGMDNLFRRLKPGELVARNNYVVQLDDSLPWSYSVGSEDSNNRGWHLVEENPAIERIHLRCERQTLRRLPRTGGIVFTIRTYLLPITEIAKEDYVPGRLASAVRSWTQDVSRYKGKVKYQSILLNYLDEEHKRQIDRGLDLDAEEQKRSYPW